MNRVYAVRVAKGSGCPSLAELTDPARRSPARVGGPHVDVQPFTEGKAEPISERQTFASSPSVGCPFGVALDDRFDREVIADQQCPHQVPVPARSTDLLGDL